VNPAAPTALLLQECARSALDRDTIALASRKDAWRKIRVSSALLRHFLKVARARAAPKFFRRAFCARWRRARGAQARRGTYTQN